MNHITDNDTSEASNHSRFPLPSRMPICTINIIGCHCRRLSANRFLIAIRVHAIDSFVSVGYNQNKDSSYDRWSVYRPRLKLKIFYLKGIMYNRIRGYFQNMRLGCTRNVVFSKGYE